MTYFPSPAPVGNRSAEFGPRRSASTTPTTPALVLALLILLLGAASSAPVRGQSPLAPPTHQPAGNRYGMTTEPATKTATELTTAPATGPDGDPTAALAYYHLGRADRRPTTGYPAVAVGNTRAHDLTCVTVYEDTDGETLGLLIPCDHPAYRVNVLTMKGIRVESFYIAATSPIATFSTAGLRPGAYLMQVVNLQGAVEGVYKGMKRR